MTEKIYKKISLQEARIMAESNEKNKDFVIIDIRTPEELEAGVVGKPTNIDFYDPDFQKNIGKLDKNKTYLVYCRSGARSRAAVQYMLSAGFTRIYEIEGGISG